MEVNQISECYHKYKGIFQRDSMKTWIIDKACLQQFSFLQKKGVFFPNNTPVTETNGRVDRVDLLLQTALPYWTRALSFAIIFAFFPRSLTLNTAYSFQSSFRFCSWNLRGNPRRNESVCLSIFFHISLLRPSTLSLPELLEYWYRYPTGPFATLQLQNQENA